MRTTARSNFTTVGRMVGGRLLIDRAEMHAAFAEFPDGDVIVTVKRGTRSSRAVGFYFGVVVDAIARFTGFDKDETHDSLKALLIPKHIAFLDKNGEVHGDVVIGASTKRLNIGEFYDYTERVRDFAGNQLGLAIRGPDPKWRELDKGE